jgi:cytochrome c-type biogenesis protein CcmH/NrfG
MIHFLQRQYTEAMIDFRNYLSVSPADDPQVRDVKTMIHRIQAMHN